MSLDDSILDLLAEAGLDARPEMAEYDPLAASYRTVAGAGSYLWLYFPGVA